MAETTGAVEQNGEVSPCEPSVADSPDTVDKTVATLEKNFEDLGKEITCAICHVHYTDPKVLPCCHYYCKECIRRLSLDKETNTNQPFSCPECRKTTTLPEGGVDDLPTATFINRMKAIHASMEQVYGKVETKCENCLKGKADAFCQQCAIFICAECVMYHQKIRMLAGHEMTTLEELKKSGEAKSILPKPVLQSCKVHKEPLKVYCFDCHHLICRDCSIKDHLGHNYEFITVAAPQMKEKLVERLDPLRKANTNLSQAIKTIETTVSEIEKQKESVDTSIKTSFDELRKILDTREKELLKETETRVKKKLKCLSNQEKSLSTSREVVQSVIDYTEHCVEHLADDEVMSMHTKIQSRIDKEIEEQITDLEPLEHADVGVVVEIAEDLKQLCQTKSRMVLDYTVTSKELKPIEVDTASVLDVTIKLPNGKPIRKTQVVKCHLKSLANGTVVECKTTPMEGGEYRIKYTPTVRGRQDLVVTVNEQEVSTKPFRVFVTIHPSKLSNPIRFVGKPYDIAMTPSGGKVIASETSIMVFDKGKRVNCFNRHTNEMFVGVAVDSTNSDVYATIYISSHNEVLKLSPDLKLLKQSKVNTTGGKSYFTGVAVVGEEVMVCDYAGKCIKVFNKELEAVRQIGSSRNISDIRGIASDEDGNLYISDNSKSCISVFSNGGDFLRSFKNSRVLSCPYGIGISGQYLYTVDCGNDNISAFTIMGDYVATFAKRGHLPDEIYSCYGACMDEDGFLHICDTSNNRIQVF